MTAMVGLVGEGVGGGASGFTCVNTGTPTPKCRGWYYLAKLSKVGSFLVADT